MGGSMRWCGSVGGSGTRELPDSTKQGGSEAGRPSGVAIFLKVCKKEDYNSHVQISEHVE